MLLVLGPKKLKTIASLEGGYDVGKGHFYLTREREDME